MARVGMRVGGCEIKGIIGEGGTGVVYRGRHLARDKLVAIKILHDRGARQQDIVAQVMGEARATSRIHHTNVIDVIDLGTTADGTVFLVMEYLEGKSLRNRLHGASRLPLFEAINILRQVARGLGAAHAAGIVHGSLKPADIFLCTRPGRRRIVRRSKAHGMRLVVEPEENFDLVKLLDFGMARFLDLAPGAQARAGAVSGTLHYLSPEQAQGQPADQRSDIYALGAVFYEMVTGVVPFGGESLLDILRGHVSGQVIAPSRRTPGAGIHMRIDALILRCLKKSPALRFASTAELCEALDDCITDCAFLRDAHRLPGIVASGIDLSQASREARQDEPRCAEKPALTPAAVMPALVEAVREAAPAVATLSTPPAGPAMTEAEPSAAVITPAEVAAALPCETSAELDDPPTRTMLALFDSLVADVDDPPERFDLELGSRRPRAMALAGVLLLGGIGIAVWATRSGSAPRTSKPVVAARTAPVPTPAPSAPSLPPQVAPPAAAPVVEPPAQAMPAPTPAPLAAAPVAAPAEMAGSTAQGSGKLASPRLRPARPAHAAKSTIAVAARPVPRSESPASSLATAVSTPPPAPATADDLVREAQHAWMAGNHAAAISKAQAALKAAPNPAQAAQAYELIATCACALGQVDAARVAISHLGDSKREAVRARCMKNGVRIE
jgi:serine/threonine-protein kinase